MTIRTALIIVSGALALSACSKAAGPEIVNATETNAVATDTTANVMNASNADIAMNGSAGDNVANGTDTNSSDDAQSSGGVVLKQ